MALKEAIKLIVEMEGKVQFPYKKTVDDHYGEIWFCHIDIGGEQSKIPWTVSHPRKGHKGFATIEEAIEFFLTEAITKNNIALAYEGLRRRKIVDTDGRNSFDDLSKDRIKELVAEYNDKYFDLDYIV